MLTSGVMKPESRTVRNWVRVARVGICAKGVDKQKTTDSHQLYQRSCTYYAHSSLQTEQLCAHRDVLWYCGLSSPVIKLTPERSGPRLQ